MVDLLELVVSVGSQVNDETSAEVVLDLENAMIGGEIKRSIIVTRFLRAAGPIQTSIGWRVEPGMGFIVDITAVS